MPRYVAFCHALLGKTATLRLGVTLPPQVVALVPFGFLGLVFLRI